MEIKIGIKALNFLTDAETGGRAYYEKYLIFPTVQKIASGVTIGCGYDLKYTDRYQFKTDWIGYISQEYLNRLLPAVGKDRSFGAYFCQKNKDIIIPYETALKQFYETELKKQIKNTLDAYPNLHELPPNAIGAMVSVIYNRGNNLDRPRMAEMKAIKDDKLISRGDLGRISQLINQSKRLWVPDAATPAAGVVTRREKEAQLVLEKDAEYLLIKI